MQEMQVQSLGQEDPLEKEMATHSSVLAWKVPWTEEPTSYSPWDYKELDMTEHAPPSWINHLPPKHFQISHLELELSIWVLRRHKSSVYNTLLPASKIHVHLTCHQLKNLSLQSHLKIEIRYEWIQGMIHLLANSIPVVNLLNMLYVSETQLW